MSVSAQKSSIHIVAEVTEGTTPNSATLTALRYSSDNFFAQANQAQDPTVTSSRVALASTRLSLQNRGTITIPLRESDSLETMFGAAFHNPTWSGGDVVAAGSTKTTLSVVKRYNAGADPYRYTGVHVNGFTLTLPGDGFGSVAFDLQGGAAPVLTTAPGTPTFQGDSPDSLLMRGSDAALTLNGGLAGITTACVTNLTLSYTNNTEGIVCIGTEGEAESNFGKATSSGSMRIAYTDGTAHGAYLAGTAFGFSLVCNDQAAAESYTFATANTTSCKLTSDATPVEGSAGTLFMDLEFDIFNAGGSGTNIVLSRT